MHIITAKDMKEHLSECVADYWASFLSHRCFVLICILYLCTLQVQSCDRSLLPSAWHWHPSTGGPDRDRWAGECHHIHYFLPLCAQYHYSLYCRIICLHYYEDLIFLPAGIWCDLIQPKLCCISYLHVSLMKKKKDRSQSLSFSGDQYEMQYVSWYFSAVFAFLWWLVVFLTHSPVLCCRV